MVKYVPVVSSSGQRLMPCHAARARQLVRQGKAIRRFDRGLFYIKLTDRESGDIQPIAIGIDPGSKKEAYTIKSEHHTYLNIQADAITWVSEAEQQSTMMRQNRRQRNTPYRMCRTNRNQGQFRLPPSTRARWSWKLRLCDWLSRYYPIETYVVEDIAAISKKSQKKWNKSFSPLEVGKTWFYQELGKLGEVKLIKGYETYTERNLLGLKKSTNKMSESFDAHCVDSWTIANWYIGGHTAPDDKAMLYIIPLRFHRRQLHKLQFAKGGIRRREGGTMSIGLKRGSWVKHSKYGVCYIGGTTNGLISIHSMQDGLRIAKVKPATLQFLSRSSWRIHKRGLTSYNATTNG